MERSPARPRMTSQLERNFASAEGVDFFAPAVMIAPNALGRLIRTRSAKLMTARAAR